MTSDSDTRDVQAQVGATATEPSARCVTCGAVREGPFCSECGQRALAGRHTLGGLLSSTLRRVIGEDGFLNTVRELTLHPARVVRDYLVGRTARYVHPVAYLLLCAASLTLAARIIGDSTGAAQSDEVFVFLIVPFVAGASRVVFWRGRHNYAEHLIGVTYLGAHCVFLLALLLVGATFVPEPASSAYLVSCLVATVAYFVWGYSGAFGRRRVLSAIAGLIALAGGIGTWLVVMTIIVRLFQR